MTTKEAADTMLDAGVRRKPRTQREVAAWARRKKLLDKLRDADIETLLATCRAFRGCDSNAWDGLADELCERMSSDKTYEQIEMLCLEVLELRKRLRRMGMDSNWEPQE